MIQQRGLAGKSSRLNDGRRAAYMESRPMVHPTHDTRPCFLLQGGAHTPRRLLRYLHPLCPLSYRTPLSLFFFAAGGEVLASS